MDESLAKMMGQLPYSLDEGVAQAEHALDALTPGVDPDAASEALDDGLDRLASAARGVLR